MTQPAKDGNGAAARPDGVPGAADRMGDLP
jgi:hypothetical protein